MSRGWRRRWRLEEEEELHFCLAESVFDLHVCGSKRITAGNIRPQSSQLAEPLWTDPGLMSGISVRELISTLIKSTGGEWMVEYSPKILPNKEKATTTSLYWIICVEYCFLCTSRRYDCDVSCQEWLICTVTSVSDLHGRVTASSQRLVLFTRHRYWAKHLAVITAPLPAAWSTMAVCRGSPRCSSGCGGTLWP